MKHARSTRTVRWLSAAAVVVAYAGIVLGGLKSFVVWDQILNLVGNDPAELFAGEQAHALRYTIMLPVLAASEALDADLDACFSACVVAMVLVTAWLTAVAAANHAGPRARTVDFLPASLAAFAALSLLQNGRIVFAFLGCSIIIASQARWAAGRSSSAVASLTTQAIGLVLMSVSSGSFMVGAITIALFTTYRLGMTWPRIRGRDARLAMFVGGLMAAVSPLIAIYIRKNLDFFGGGWDAIVPMLGHGPGELLLEAAPNPVAVLVIVAFAAGCAGAVLLVLWHAHRRDPLIPLWLSVFATLLLGPFGYSTLFTGLPAVVALLLVSAGQRARARAWRTPSLVRC